MAKKADNQLSDGDVKVGFTDKTINLRIEQFIPTKPITRSARCSRKYEQILSSIKIVGIIEPPVVIRESSNSELFIILDGHLRIEALKEMGESKVTCLISTDDEAFTYNKHINRLSTIQEHKMILRAIDRGVPEEKIAQALGLDVRSIIQKRNLLTGVCPEAAELLKDKMAPIGVFRILRKMKPIRQMQAATLMNDAGIYSVSYASVLWAATPTGQLVNPEKPKKVKGLTDDQMGRMENEMVNLEREYQLVEDSYGADVLNLTLAKGYLTQLLTNAKVINYLAQNHSGVLSQFQRISELESLGEMTTEARC